MDELQEDHLSSIGELEVDADISTSLYSTSKWAKFIGIGFYAVTVILIAYYSYLFYGVFDITYSAYRNLVIEIVLILFLCVAVIGVAYYFLINFANKIRTGIETGNMEKINAGLRSLRVHFIILGVISVLALLNNLLNF